VKILLLRSNPRKNGFTDTLLQLFVKGLNETCQLIDYDLTKSNIKPCLGCFHCWTNTPGVCIQKDAMKELLDYFLSADILILASPLYAFSVSSYCKIFLERTLPLLAPGVEKNEDGTDRNLLRFPEKGPKKLATLIVGGLKSPLHMQGLIGSLKSYASSFGMQFAGALIRPESYILQFEGTKPKTMKTIETAFYQAGLMLGQTGFISADLEEKAALPLAPDLDHFQMYSNIYWNYAMNVCKQKGDLEEARLLTNRDIHLLMHEMSRCLDPVATKGIRAIFQFEFTDLNIFYCICVDRGNAIMEQKLHQSPDLTIECKSTTWVSVILRETDGVKEFTSGNIVLKGDKSFFRKLHRYFPPPST
jgi:multimeric flavodoxin WrbA